MVSLGHVCFTERKPSPSEPGIACLWNALCFERQLWGVHMFGPFGLGSMLSNQNWMGVVLVCNSLPRKTLGVSGSGRVSQRTALFL